MAIDIENGNHAEIASQSLLQEYSYRGDIARLKAGIDELYFWQKWIFPANLLEVLNSPEATGFSIYLSFVNHVWFFQRWLISCLNAFSNSTVMRACDKDTCNGPLS